MIRRHRALAAVVLVGLIAAVGLLGYRWRLEAATRTVEIVLDGEAWWDLAVREGRPPWDLFAALRQEGATSVALYESTLRRLREGGRAFYLSEGELLAARRGGALAGPLAALAGTGTVRRGAVYVTVEPSLAPWVEEGLTAALGRHRLRRVPGALEVLGMREDVEEVPLGFLPSTANAFRNAGFSLVLRPRNYRGFTEETLAARLAQYRRLGSGQTVIFERADVLGYERLIEQAAAGLTALGYRYGRIETFSVRRRQRGEETLTAFMRPSVVRVFSVTPEELAGLAPPLIVDKYVRAPLERGIRLIYVRPLTNTPGGVDAWEANIGFVRGVAGGVIQHGFAIGRASPLPQVRYPLILLALAAAGALALGAIGLGELALAAGMRISERVLFGLVAVGLAVTGLAWAAGGAFTTWRKALALGTAVAGATLATAAWLAERERAPARPGAVLRQSLAVLWKASALSAAAGVLVAALLTSWSFMLAVDIFTGVKLAHVLPPALAGFLLAFAGRKDGNLRSTLGEVWRWLDRPLRLQYAVVAVAVAVGAVMLLGRSGNLGLPLFAVEAKMRAVLEELLVARPRTKEFLIGHPALMLAAAAHALGLRPWVIPLAIVGAVGQAGIINSFSHIHAPLVLIVWRTVNALVIGSALGAGGVVLLTAAVRRWWPGAAGRQAAVPRMSRTTVGARR